jgi:hemoglobin
MARIEELDEAALKFVVDDFYRRVRADHQLGPAFAVVVDWDGHTTRLAAFWSSVMLSSGRYKGTPVATHLKMPRSMNDPLLARWLEIWRATTADLLAPALAQAIQARAARIAESLRLAVLHRSRTAV